MGIHDNTNKPNQPGTAQVPPMQNQAQPQVTPHVTANVQGQPSAMENALNMGTTLNMDHSGQFDWVTLNKDMLYHVNISPNSLSLSQFEKAMREYWDQNTTQDLIIDMFTVDRNSNPNLAVSILVIVTRINNSETSPLAYYTLLIENSIEHLPPRYDTVNGRQYEIMLVTSDLYDEFMMQQIQGHVKSRYPKAEIHLDADAEVIPRHFDLTKEENIRNVTINAILACRSVLVKITPEFKDINLINARRNTANLSQTVQFQHNFDQELDQTGFPVRSDIVITTMATPVQNPNNYITQTQTPLTRVTGYVDLLYQDTNNHFTQQFNQMWYPQPQMNNGITPVYQANFVITQMINSKMQTLPGMLLALINASSMRENNLFISSFMPSPDNKDSMHDIGNIGYDIPIFTNDKGEPVYGKLPTTPDKFNTADLAQLYTRFFHPGLAISLDIPECGSTSWMYKTIASAAKENPQALAELRNAANTLTNGAFERYYQAAGGTGRTVFSNDNTVFLGYYETKDGRRRDIRDLDYLAVCGLMGKKNRDEIRYYTDSYNGAYSLVERISYRRNLIGTNLSKVTFTGRAYRVSFEAAFILALVQGAIECGYHVVPQSYAADITNYHRTNATYINGAVLNANTSGIFKTLGYNNPTGRSNAYGRF